MQEQRTRILLDYPLPEERVFRYQAMQDIVHHLVNNPFEEFTQQDLARITGADVSTVSRSVDLLARLGLLTVANGKPARISLDQNHIDGADPLFAIPQQEFRQPISAFLDQLTAKVDAADHIDAIVGVVLFGSVARGTADRSSDIDLLVIVDGAATYGRRVVSTLTRKIEDRTFGGDRYQFEVLVETPESAASHGEQLREIFDAGIVLQRTDALEAVRTSVYQRGSSDG